MKALRAPSASPGRWLKAVACLSIALAASSSASASSSPTEARVALVTASAQSTTTTRLKAELEQLGVSVVVVAGEATPLGRASLENIARTAGAFAAVRVVPVAAEVEVWVADRVTGKTVVREVIRGRDSSASMDDTIALGAVELLRASLLEFTATPMLQHGEVEPPPVVRTIAPAPEPSGPRFRRPLPPLFAVAFEPTAVVGFDGALAALSAGVAARYQFVDHLALEGWAQVPIVAATIRQDATGVAEVSATVLGLGLAAVWNAHGITPSVGAGAAGALLEVDGQQPQPGYGANRKLLRVTAPYVRAGIGIQLLEHLRLHADATGLYTVHSIPIRFVGEQRASWGRPSLLVGLGLEVLLPRQ